MRFFSPRMHSQFCYLDSWHGTLHGIVRIQTFSLLTGRGALFCCATHKTMHGFIISALMCTFEYGKFAIWNCKISAQKWYYIFCLVQYHSFIIPLQTLHINWSVSASKFDNNDTDKSHIWPCTHHPPTFSFVHHIVQCWPSSFPLGCFISLAVLITDCPSHATSLVGVPLNASDRKLAALHLSASISISATEASNQTQPSSPCWHLNQLASDCEAYLSWVLAIFWLQTFIEDLWLFCPLLTILNSH